MSDLIKSKINIIIVTDPLVKDFGNRSLISRRLRRCNFHDYRCFLAFSLVYSDKETSLTVVKTHNNSNNSSESSDDGSFLVSISKRCDYLSDKSIICYVEEPKAFRFVFHDYYSSPIQEKMKMITFSDESNTSFVLEKPFVVEDNKLKISLSEGCFIKEHVKEEMLIYKFMSCGVFMLVYEFMSCGVLKGLLAHKRSFSINIQLIIGAAHRFLWFQMLIANDLSVLCACLKRVLMCCCCSCFMTEKILAKAAEKSQVVPGDNILG
ncbi:unnamed protein product [Brassica napus]|uniref:(rape) hypothetical protein n=1 Tax=Brassica napus TaxID=3708 RepID=A0A816QVH9_BRANA|nr:unnamed protein product [Brassica napus]